MEYRYNSLSGMTNSMKERIYFQIGVSNSLVNTPNNYKTTYSHFTFFNQALIRTKSILLSTYQTLYALL
jgi:hypothetical protein